MSGVSTSGSVLRTAGLLRVLLAAGSAAGIGSGVVAVRAIARPTGPATNPAYLAQQPGASTTKELGAPSRFAPHRLGTELAPALTSPAPPPSTPRISLPPPPQPVEAPAAPAAPAATTPASPGALENIPPVPDFPSTCTAELSQGPDAPACETSAIAAIDHARALEGLGPLWLPADFLDLAAAEQLVILIDEERVARGLAPAVGVSPQLSTLAAEGAAANTDPPLAPLANGGGPWVVGAYATWAADYSSAGSVYDWLYDDGWGGSPATTTNITCTGPDAPGCWSHRANLLASAPAGDVPVLGVASQPESAQSADAGLESDAIVLSFVPEGDLASLQLTWTWPGIEGTGAAP